MSQNVTPKKVARQERVETVALNIFNGITSFTELAKLLGVNRRTIYRDWRLWIDSHEIDKVDAEWWALFKRLKEDNPEKAFDGLTRLKIKQTKELSEIEVKGIPKFVVEIVDNSKNPVPLTSATT